MCIKAQLFLKIYAELNLWNTYNRAAATAAVATCAGDDGVVRKAKRGSILRIGEQMWTETVLDF